ncbi:blastula protease 10-like [Anneissia japonica]|uniref:blastula protease 10-like n=1 Tax=Anneissia japonica TaxID=1529436 RepID=UPI0014259FA9|nr:blastula protease 10-like [Anneissia japonica]
MSKMLMCFLLLSVFIHCTFAHPTKKLQGPPPNLRPEEIESEDTFEGDIKLTEAQREQLENEILGGPTKRKAIKNQFYRWDDAIIPYEIADESLDNEAVIRSAIEHWESNTCVRFREASSGHRVLFTKQDGCWSHIGKIDKKPQPISIGEGCESLGTIAHEIGHAAGFFHEQSRPDRDDFVEILWGNVKSGYSGNFEKQGTSVINTMDVPYDLTSLMHYGKDFFTKNGLPTIVTVDPILQDVIGERSGLSFQDIHLANLMYECDVDCTGTPCKNGGYRRSTNGCNCLCPPNFSGTLCQTEETPDSCSMTIDESESSSGSISSPNYPENYSNNLDCNIYFKGTSKLTVTFNVFDLEPHSSCNWDYVDIRTDNFYYSGNKFCGTNKPETIVKEDGKLLLAFHSDGIETAGGYTATYAFEPTTAEATTKTSESFTTNEVTGLFTTNEVLLQTIACTGDSVVPRNYDLIESSGLGFRHGFMTAWADVDGNGFANAYCRIMKTGGRRFPSCLKPDGTEFTIPGAGTVQFDVGYKKTAFMRDMDNDGKDDFCRCIRDGRSSKFRCVKAGTDYFRPEEGFDLVDAPYDGQCKTVQVDHDTGFIY